MSASLAAGSAIKKAIFAEAYAELALASAAVFLAQALRLGSLALQADVGFGGSNAGAHGLTLSAACVRRKCPRELVGLGWETRDRFGPGAVYASAALKCPRYHSTVRRRPSSKSTLGV